MSYTYLDLKSSVIDSTIDKSLSSMVDLRTKFNQAVREVIGDVDLRSTKRRNSSIPNLFSDIYDYSAPSDLKDDRVVDLIPQTERNHNEEWVLCSPEEFDRRKRIERRLIAVDSYDGIKKLRVSVFPDDNYIEVSQLDSLDDNGSLWTAVGDATNLRIDRANYVKGNGSFEYDIGAGGTTTAGIENSGLQIFDLTDYLDSGSVFVNCYLTSITNITNLIIKIGSDSSNYYKITATTQADGTAFRAGWNLIKFSISSAIQTGTVINTACNYVSVYMTKDVSKINEVDYRFDYIQIRNGKYYDLEYYSEFGWQTSSGVWIEASTADTDILNAGPSEFDLIVQKCKELLFMDMKEYNDATYWSNKYGNEKVGSLHSYLMVNPSEAKVLTSTLREF